MARAFTPKTLTASRLLEGDVAYLGPDGHWVDHIADAMVFDNEDSAHAALADAQAEPHLWVGPYLADIQIIDGTPAPAHYRETFRTTGPSNYHHGKQEVARV
ncbi:MAG: DUF2849 domain-containing protein [Pseudomonadota bacterium]